MSDKPVNSQMNENDLKIPPLADTDGFPEEISSNLSSDSTSSSVPAGNFPAEGPNPALPAASSKSPASSHSVENPLAGTLHTYVRQDYKDQSKSHASSHSVENPLAGTLHTYVRQDYKDQSIVMLESKKQALEREIQGSKDFANEVVMEVTKNLQEIQGELKMLRQDKQDREIAENVRRGLEECTNKQMSEMEHELLYTTRTLDVFDIRINQLEEENFELRMDLEAAEVDVLESAARLQLAVAMEKETLETRDLISAEKVLLRDQLNDLKSQVAELNNQRGKAKERLDQFKVLLKHREGETERIEEQIENLNIERKKDDALTEAKLDNIEQTGKRKMHKLEEEIKNLENKISKLKSETSKSETPALKGKAVLQGKAGAESRKRERECVMCLTKERSVVFLPCAHQLLCQTCNEVHKNGGMNDCLICRTVIEKRISARFG